MLNKVCRQLFNGGFNEFQEKFYWKGQEINVMGSSLDSLNLEFLLLS